MMSANGREGGGLKEADSMDKLLDGDSEKGVGVQKVQNIAYVICVLPLMGIPGLSALKEGYAYASIHFKIM